MRTSTLQRVWGWRYQVEVRKGERQAIRLYYVTDPQDLPEFYAWLETQTAIGIDIETDGRSPDGLNYLSKKIATVQVGNPTVEDPRAFVFCVRSLGDEVIRELVERLAARRYFKLGQNIRFELIWLTHKYGVEFANCGDTQLAELIIRAGLFPSTKGARGDDGLNRKCYSDTSMDKLCRRHLDLRIDKSDESRLDFWVTPAGELTKRQLMYAAGDVIYPFYIYEEQRKEIRARGLSEIVKIEFALIPTLVDSELYGIEIDTVAWRKLWQEAIDERERARRQLDQVLLRAEQQGDLFGVPERPTSGTTRKGKRRAVTVELNGQTGTVTRVEGTVLDAAAINYDSPAQVVKALKRYCRLINWPVEIVTTLPRLQQIKRLHGESWLERHPEKTADDIPDWVVPEDRYLVLLKFEADDLRLARLRKQLPEEFVVPYLAYKAAAKRAGTYGIGFLEKNVSEHDGRIHVYFHQALTTTGRLSSEPNLQNIDRDPRYRACFKPRPGNVFCIADYSQIEPRLSAEESQDPVYLGTFRDGADIYVRSGEAMGGRPIDKKTPEGKLQRQIYKALILALAYNMGPTKLRNALTLALENAILDGKVELPTLQMARELHKRFFEVHYGIRTFQEVCIAVADPATPARPPIYDKYLDDVVTWVAGKCGRKRFFRPDCKTTYTEAPNGPIQGTSATITKLAAVLIRLEAEKAGIPCHVVNYVHDELLVETAKEHAATMRTIVKTQMEAAAARYIKTVPVIADFPAGTDEGIADCWVKEG